MALASGVSMNNDRGPCTRRRTFATIGADTPLVWNGMLPRRITVLGAGNISVTYFDGTTETLMGIAAGTVFFDCCWQQINQTSTTATNISVGW